MESFGESKEDWLRTFLRLPEGIPSHDTFNRVFSALDPKELEQCFIEWTRSVANLTKNEVVSIDGKTMRGTREYGSKSVVHMVSAWASGNHIVLGQLKVEEKSNEITAIPKLLSLLVLKGCIVTIDAMGCQKDIASAIIDKEADYLLALKGNQGNLQEQVEDSFRFLPVVSASEETDMGHGRVETRGSWMLPSMKTKVEKESIMQLRIFLCSTESRFIYSKMKNRLKSESKEND